MSFKGIAYLALFLCCAAVPLTAPSQQRDSQPKWEHVESAPAEDTGTDRTLDVANVRVQDMHIYVDLDRPAQVKLFTILGQPVSQMQLPAGTSRFRVAARGIYILKIGSSTRRITI